MTTTVRGPARPAPGRAASTAGRLPSTPHPVVLGVSAIVLAVNIGVMAAGAWLGGSSTDDGYHVDRLQNFLARGWYVLAEQMDGASPASTTVDAYVYAPVSALLGHAVAVLLGFEGTGEVAVRADAASARHLAVVAIALVGLWAVAALARLLLGSWRWGLVAAALLSAFPVWTGYGMFNSKDVPVAVGFTLLTLALAMLGRRPGARSSRIDAAAMVVAAVGLVIAVGTRPGIWPALALSAAVLLTCSAWLESVHSGMGVVAAAARRILLLVGAATVAYLVLLAVYPKAFSTPFTLLRESATVSADYSVVWGGFSVTNGSGHGQPPPLGYIPDWMINQLPIVLLVLGAAGVVVSFVAVGRLLGRQAQAHASPHAVAVVLVLTQAFALPLVAIALRSALYGGLRQILLVLPALAVLAALGLKGIGDRLENVVVRWPAHLVAVPLAIGLVVPTVDGIRLFPYGYAYFNEIATLQPIEQRWPTDFYNLSFRELATDVDASLPAFCGQTERTFLLGPEPETVDPRRGTVGDCTAWFTISAYVPSLAPGDPEVPSSGGSFWYLRSNRFTSTLPDNCTVVKKVTRPLHGQTLVMSWLARCEVPRP